MPKYTFFTQAARDGTTIASSSEELVNLYPEQAPGDARTRINLRSVLGEDVLTQVGASIVRAAEVANELFYTIVGGNLYEVAEDGSVVSRGSVGNSVESGISSNNGNVCVVSSGTYRVWDGALLSSPATGAFSSVGSVEFNDYDTIITELNGRRFSWSNTADAKTFNALNFATAEARDGDILRAQVHSAQLFLMTKDCIEVWRSTGVTGAARYRRLTVIDQGRGLAGYHLVTKGAFGIFFIANDGVAYILSGSGIMPVSTPAVQTDLQEGNPTAVFYYEDRGHKFCVIRFAGRPAWVYDLTTQLWHRRQTGVERGSWGIQRMALAYGKWLGVDDFGFVVEMKRNNTDRGNALLRMMRGKPLYMEGTKFSIAEFEALCSVGESNLGRAAEVMLRWSRNGGQTWVGTRTASIGDLGQYDTTVNFYALGRGESFTPELSCAEATDVVFYSDANVRIT